MPAHPVIPPLDRAGDRYAPGRRTNARPVDTAGKGAALAGSLLLNLGLLAGVVAAMRAPDFAPAGAREVLVSVALRPETRRSAPPPERPVDPAPGQALPRMPVAEPLAPPRPRPASVSGPSPAPAARPETPDLSLDTAQAPAALPPPSVAEPDSADRAGQGDRYRRMVWERILAARPRSAREHGTVTLGFSLDGAGRLVSSHVSGSSGQFLLDRLALQALRRAAPFPPPPQGLGSGVLAFTVPVEFH